MQRYNGKIGVWVFDFNTYSWIFYQNDGSLISWKWFDVEYYNKIYTPSPWIHSPLNVNPITLRGTEEVSRVIYNYFGRRGFDRQYVSPNFIHDNDEVNKYRTEILYQQNDEINIDRTIIHGYVQVKKYLQSYNYVKPHKLIINVCKYYIQDFIQDGTLLPEEWISVWSSPPSKPITIYTVSSYTTNQRYTIYEEDIHTVLQNIDILTKNPDRFYGRKINTLQMIPKSRKMYELSYFDDLVSNLDRYKKLRINIVELIENLLNSHGYTVVSEGVELMNKVLINNINYQRSELDQKEITFITSNEITPKITIKNIKTYNIVVNKQDMVKMEERDNGLSVWKYSYQTPYEGTYLVEIESDDNDRYKIHQFEYMEIQDIQKKIWEKDLSDSLLGQPQYQQSILMYKQQMNRRLKIETRFLQQTSEIEIKFWIETNEEVLQLDPTKNIVVEIWNGDLKLYHTETQQEDGQEYITIKIPNEELMMFGVGSYLVKVKYNTTLEQFGYFFIDDIKYVTVEQSEQVEVGDFVLFI